MRPRFVAVALALGLVFSGSSALIRAQHAEHIETAQATSKEHRTPTDSAAVRRALQAQYDEMGRAIAAKDVDRVLRLFSPLDTTAEDGRSWWQAFVARRRFLTFEITLDTIVVRGDTARVGYTEHNIHETVDAGVTHRREVTAHEVAWWVRTPAAWLHRNFVRDGVPRRVIDGVEQPARHADSLVADSARALLRRTAWPSSPGGR